MSFYTNANEVKLEVVDTKDGFVLKSDVPSGMTSSANFNNKSIHEASFSFILTELRGNDNWPAGANFSFMNIDELYSFHFALLLDSSISTNVIAVIKLVKNGELLTDYSQPTEFTSLQEITLHFKWQDHFISLAINKDKAVEVPFPHSIGEFTFGLQSSKGEIGVHLPNKANQ